MRGGNDEGEGEEDEKFSFIPLSQSSGNNDFKKKLLPLSFFIHLYFWFFMRIIDSFVFFFK